MSVRVLVLAGHLKVEQGRFGVLVILEKASSLLKKNRIVSSLELKRPLG